MRCGTLLFLASLLMLSDGALAQSPAPKLRVTADCYKVGNWKSDKGADFEDWAYKITLQNTSGQDLTDLEIRYRVFLHEEINADGTPDSPITFNESKITLEKLLPSNKASSKAPAPPPPDPTLKRSETRVGSTPPMAVGVGAGGNIRADRNIFKGIWIRVFTKSGEEIGSFVKPSSFAKSMPWQ